MTHKKKTLADLYYSEALDNAMAATRAQSHGAAKAWLAMCSEIRAGMYLADDDEDDDQLSAGTVAELRRRFSGAEDLIFRGFYQSAAEELYEARGLLKKRRR